MSEYQELLERDGPELLRLKPPVRRAAYSDRTAWQMAVLAELAYVKFEAPNDGLLAELAQELAEIDSVDNIAKRLISLREILKTPSAGAEDRLRAALQVAGFVLVGTFYNQTLDPMQNTEGFVAKKIDGEGADFAVLSIRGTTSIPDWINNANVGLESVGGGRLVHKGFHKAFKDAEEQIRELLSKVDELPLFITGHSLGGAVAVMATWYFKRDTLAACYTFGGPRAGNHALNDAFHTPIYRVVNAFDPVPMVPPTERAIASTKFALRLLSKFGGSIVLDPVIKWLTSIQGYRHAGDLRQMTDGEMDSHGRYPTVKHFTQFGLAERFARAAKLLTSNQLKRLDVYHNMATYRRKLRSRALGRAPQ
tara:strand:+ start:14848 stop:15942 length:1095 start_codon:yes stop_codon:yes gene_type:complete